MPESETTLSIGANAHLLRLFEAVKDKEHPESSRNSIFYRAVNYSLHKSINWKNMLAISMNIKEKLGQEYGYIPESRKDSIKLKIDEQQYNKIAEEIKKALSLQRVRHSFITRILVTAYYEHFNMKPENKEPEKIKTENEKPEVSKASPLRDTSFSCQNMYAFFEINEGKAKWKIKELCTEWLEKNPGYRNELANNSKQNIQANKSLLEKLLHTKELGIFQKEPSSDFLAQALAGYVLSVLIERNIDIYEALEFFKN